MVWSLYIVLLSPSILYTETKVGEFRSERFCTQMIESYKNSKTIIEVKNGWDGKVIYHCEKSK